MDSTTRDSTQSGNQLQAEFVSLVSHGLRTPVSTIVGYADLLVDGLYGEITSDQRDVLQHMKNAACGLLGTIENLLNHTVLARGETDLVLRRFTLIEVLRDVLKSCRTEYEHKQLTVSHRIEPPDLAICSDRVKVQLILTNLVRNAIRHTPRGWIELTATVRAGNDGSQPVLEITVADSGVGIGNQDRERVFECFHRGEMENTVGREGIGLGLFIVRSMVRMLNGNIELKSEPSQGAVFTVTLPLQFEEAKAIQTLVEFNQAARGQADAASGRVVICLGTDQERCRVLSERLRAHRIEVVPVEDARNVVQKVASLRPAAILLDPRMAETNGRDLFDFFKSNPVTRGVPVLYVMNSTHEVTLPRPAERPSVPPAPKPAPVAQALRPRVLVTDDDPSLRAVLKLALESEGYLVSLANDGQEALRMVLEERPDLVLLDLMMPNLNGWELADIIAHQPELDGTKVLLLTGAVVSLDEAQRLTRGKGGVLRKENFQMSNILAGVASALGQTN